MPKYRQGDKIMRVKFAKLGDDDLLLAGLRGTEAISELFHFHLDLLSENFLLPVAFDQVLGTEVRITFPHPSGARYIHGFVSQFERGMPAPGPDGAITFIRYHAEVVPRHWLLTKRVQTRVFHQMVVPDIVKAVLSGMTGLNVDDQKLDPGYPRRDHCVQYQESDFAFASRLMEAEGIYYYFKHEQDKHTLVLGDTPQCHEDVPAATTVRLDAGNNVPFGEDTVKSWRKSQRIASGKYTSWDYSFADAAKNLSGSADITAEPIKVGRENHSLRVAGNTDNCTLFEYPAGYASFYDPSSNETAISLARDRTRIPGLRIQAEAAASLDCSGNGTCRHFTAGCKFTLDAGLIFPTSLTGYGGEYVLTRVEHTASVEVTYTGLDPEFSVRPYSNRFECLPIALPYRPPRRTPRPIIAGLQTAVVVGTDNTDADPDWLCRVRIQCFWHPNGQNNLKNQKGDKLLPLEYWSAQTPDAYPGYCWVRAAQVWADRKFGTLFVPRLGQEVVVGFLDGDPDRPLIVGCVYNDVNQPAFPLPDCKLVSGMKTHTAGAEDTRFTGIAFDDTPFDPANSAKKSTTTFILQSEGNMVFNIKKGLTMNINGDFIINLTGNQTINQSGKFG